MECYSLPSPKNGKLGGGNLNIFLIFIPQLGKIPILSNIFPVGWFNHQPGKVCDIPWREATLIPGMIYLRRSGAPQMRTLPPCNVFPRRLPGPAWKSGGNRCAWRGCCWCFGVRGLSQHVFFHMIFFECNKRFWPMKLYTLRLVLSKWLLKESRHDPLIIRLYL